MICFWRKRAIYTVYVFRALDAWRFNAKAANGEILFQSEAYTRPEDAKRAARALCAARLEFKE